MKCYWMLQNTWVTNFTVSELLRENQHGLGVGKINLSPTQIRVKETNGGELLLTANFSKY